jgi:hypothetical protein
MEAARKTWCGWSRRARAEFGPIHILFFNAYVGNLHHEADRFSTTDEHFQEAFNLNMLAPLRPAKTLVPNMKAEKYGSIINLLFHHRPGDLLRRRARLHDLLTRAAPMSCNADLRSCPLNFAARTLCTADTSKQAVRTA